MRKKITAAGLKILFLVMNSCPAVPTNGGQEAKRLLRLFAQQSQDIEYGEFLDRMNAWKKNHTSSKNLEDLYDVYEHIGDCSGEIVDGNAIINFFSGEQHAAKIWKEISEDSGENCNELYKCKLLFGHMLIPVTINEISKGRASGVYKSSVSVRNLLLFSENDIKRNDVALVHYGFILKKAEGDEFKKVSSANNFSGTLDHAYAMVSKSGIDFKEMHYFKRSLKIAEEAKSLK